MAGTIRLRLPGVALMLAILSLALCGAASAKSGPWVSAVDKTYGIRVSVPESWSAVPPTVAGVQSLVDRLTKKKETELAQIYLGFINTAEARAQMQRYIFQVFQYSPGMAVQPDFALAVAKTTKSVAGNPAAISASFAKSYATQPGTTVTKHTVVKLPAGPAALIEGTQSVQGGPVGEKTQFQIYVIPHGTLLFDLSFRADASVVPVAATFEAIARRFAFV